MDELDIQHCSLTIIHV